MKQAIFITTSMLIPLTIVWAEDARQPSIQIVSREVIFSHTSEQLHFPFLHEAADGNWYMTYREGPHGPPDGDRVQCVMSKDRGKTWVDWPDLKAEPLLRFFRTQLKDGTWISHRYELVSREGANGVAIILKSSDGGASWLRLEASVAGMPFPEDGYAGLWGHIRQLPDGRLLCGIYGRPQPKRRRYINGVLESRDQGRSWRYLANVCADVSLGREGPNETDLLVLADGNLICIFRTGGAYMQQARSNDGGKTWSEPSSLGIVGVSPQLLQLQTGAVVCSFGRGDTVQPRDVHVMVDATGTAKHWSKPVLVYRGPGSGYTDIQAIGPDRFRLVYDESPFGTEKENYGRIVRTLIRIAG